MRLFNSALYYFGIIMTTHAYRYDGTYRLTRIEAVDFGGEINIPDDREFSLRIKAIGTTDTKEEELQYDLNVKIGNSLGALISVTPASDDGGEQDTVSVSNVISTRMMPPPELYTIERALSAILPAAEKIHYNVDTSMLQIEGRSGSIQCIKSDDLSSIK